jgi:hypothetical protein
MTQSHLNRRRSDSEVGRIFVGLELLKLNAVLNEKVHAANPRVETMPKIDLQLHRESQTPDIPCHSSSRFWKFDGKAITPCVLVTALSADEQLIWSYRIRLTICLVLSVL